MTAPSPPASATDPILRLLRVKTETGLSKSTIYQLIKDGTFPKPVKLGRRAVGWRESDIAGWQASRPQTS
jgi:prophage regulatory protein